MIGGIAETQEMLDFCAEHDVRPEIEVIAPDYINEAYERVLASDVRYRFVIDTQSLRALDVARSAPRRPAASRRRQAWRRRAGRSRARVVMR